MVFGNAAGALINILKVNNIDDSHPSPEPLSISNTSDVECGIHYLITSKSEEVDNELPESTMFLMVGVFLALQVIGIILTFFLVDIADIKLKAASKQISTVQINPDGSQLLLDNRNDEEKSLHEKDVTIINGLINNNNNEIHINIEKSLLDLKPKDSNAFKETPAPPKISIFASLASVFKLLSEDMKAFLMILLTLNYAFIHSFVSGDYTRSWITCVFGKCNRLY